MISVSQLTVQFGGVSLFEDISFLINPKDRIGLVGKNGAGKSTLLKILSGIQKPSAGTVAVQSGATVGYLPQDMDHNVGKTIFDEAATAFIEVKAAEKKLADINHQLETRTDYESDEYMDLIHQLNDINERFGMIGGYTMDADIELVLLGLGFERKDFTKKMEEFSGGWQMRVELAKSILQKPHLLILDEPTNHLDIESIQWLEDYLKNYFGAVVLVSHDRAFLDNVTNRTIEITMGKIYDYKTTYSRYVELRKERKTLQMSEQKNQEKYIEHTQELINKFRAKKNKAAFAQSLIKKLDKLEIVEVDDDDNSSIHFRFPPAQRSGKVVIEAENLSKSYGAKNVFSKIDFMVEREERIALIGKNGEGKSTMLKIIVGDTDYEGKMQIGHNINIGYYAQNQAETLDGEKTVFETIDDIAVGDMRKNVRNLLGSFLFGGDSVDKKVKVLSGGEKSRLAMCKLLLQPYNLLVLDEPTNHLDMRSKDVLKNALMKYDGTLVVVSHDRDFLQGLTGKVYEFAHGKVKQHIGDVYDFLESKKMKSLMEFNSKGKIDKQEKPKVDIVVETPAIARPNKEKEKEQKRMVAQLSKCEEEISRLEKSIADFDKQLMDPEKYKELMNKPETFSEYEKLKKQLEAEMQKWEDLQLKIETVNS